MPGNCITVLQYLEPVQLQVPDHLIEDNAPTNYLSPYCSVTCENVEVVKMLVEKQGITYSGTSVGE